MSPILQQIRSFTLTAENLHLIPLNFFLNMKSLESFTVMSHEDSKPSRERMVLEHQLKTVGSPQLNIRLVEDWTGKILWEKGQVDRA
jgi:hypothetical protein